MKNNTNGITKDVTNHVSKQHYERCNNWCNKNDLTDNVTKDASDNVTNATTDLTTLLTDDVTSPEKPVYTRSESEERLFPHRQAWAKSINSTRKRWEDFYVPDTADKKII